MRVGQLQRTFHGFGTARGKEGASHAGEIAKSLRKLTGVAVGVLRGEVHHLGRLIGHCLEQTRVGVSKGIHAKTRHQVEVLIAGGVKKVNTFASVHYDGKPGINGEQNLGIPMQHRERVGILPKWSVIFIVHRTCHAGSRPQWNQMRLRAYPLG